MRTVDFEPDLIKTIWSIVASILHLGQINFASKNEIKNKTASDKNTDCVQIHHDSIGCIKTIANLLNLNESELHTSLTSRLIATGSRDVLTKFYTLPEASYAKNALAKALYEKLFGFIFSRINQILNVKGKVFIII